MNEINEVDETSAMNEFYELDEISVNEVDQISEMNEFNEVAKSSEID